MSPFRLRVVHVAGGDGWSGPEINLYHLARAQTRRDDMAVQVITLRHGPLTSHLTAALPLAMPADGRFLHRLSALHAQLKSFRPHVVHCHTHQENLMTALATHGTGAIALRTIANDTAPAPARPRSGIADAVAANLQRGAICTSPHLLPAARARYPSLIVEAIEPGLHIEELEAAADQPLDQNGFAPGMRIGFAGRPLPAHRPDLFIAMAHQLTRRQPGRFGFHLFGDGTLRPECAAFIARHRLGDALRLFDYSRQRPAWLRRMDLLVLCAAPEGIPTVLLEAMVLGIPVIACAAGAIPHLLGCGEFGLLVRDQNPEAYAAAVQHITATPKETAERTRRAREQVERRYGIDLIAERYAAFYRTLLSTQAASVSATPGLT